MLVESKFTNVLKNRLRASYEMTSIVNNMREIGHTILSQKYPVLSPAPTAFTESLSCLSLPYLFSIWIRRLQWIMQLYYKVTNFSLLLRLRLFLLYRWRDLAVNTTIKMSKSNCSRWFYLIITTYFGPYLGPSSGSLFKHVSCYWNVLIQKQYRILPLTTSEF
jgi:hypothetical protein